MAEINTFSEQLAKEATELTAFNGINLIGIKDSLEKMLSQIGRNGIFDEYTRHDISHVNIMLGLVNDIIPQHTKDVMTKADWLLIVLSVYFHDLGMLVSNTEYKNRNQNQSFKNFKKDYESKQINQESLKSLSSEKAERFIYQEYVRKNHGKRISDWLIGENENLYDSKIVELVQDMVDKLNKLVVKDIAAICESHNEDDLDNDEKYPIKQEYGMDPQEKGNVFYAALILRTADLLHITGDRAPTEEYQIISPTNPISQTEWAKQCSVSSVSPKDQVDKDGNVDKTIQSDTFVVTGYFEDPKGFFPLMDYLGYARKQLQASFRLNEEMKKKYSMSYDFPWKDIDDSKVKTKDYERHQLSFTVDQQKILDLLMGETLYNNSTVSLRELAQNAIDAVELRKYDLGKKKRVDNYCPQVEVKWNPETRQLIVADNGTGMNMDIIQKHLLKVGSSRYSDKEFLKEHSDFYSISKFGIGLLTCFLVAEDVDILTQDDSIEKPLLLKVSKLHGKYLLKHGKEKDSPLALLNNAPTGTSIMLKIKHDIVDFNPETILRDWILFPNCNFTYVENGKKETIGYTDTKSLIEDVLRTNGISLDNKEYKIVGQKNASIDISVLLKYNKFLREWSFVDYSELFRNDKGGVIPCGICVKGIRIDKDTPGFSVQKFVAVANLTGKDAPYPNVARTAIEAQSLNNILEKLYDVYLTEVKKQIDDIAKQYSITWALTELPFLLESFFDRRTDPLIKKDVFNKSLEKQQFFLVHHDRHELMSIEDLKKIGHFWTIDSVAYNSAISLIREAKTSDQYAITILKRLYENDSKLFDGVDVVLDNSQFLMYLGKLLFDIFEITDIRVFEDFRSLNLRWDIRNIQSSKWYKIENAGGDSWRYNHFYNDNANSIFIQNESINISTKQYEGIRCDYGIFILEGSKIHNYLLELIKLYTTNESDLAAIVSVFSFVVQQFGSTHDDENWEYSFENYIAENYSHDLMQILKSKIDVKKLITACKESSFTLYDKRLWYRR